MKPVKGPGGARGLLAGSWAQNVAIDYKEHLKTDFSIYNFSMETQLTASGSARPLYW